MKIIYEFNMEKDRKTKLYACECAQAMLMAIDDIAQQLREWYKYCLLYTSPSPRD